MIVSSPVSENYHPDQFLSVTIAYTMVAITRSKSQKPKENGSIPSSLNSPSARKTLRRISISSLSDLASDLTELDHEELDSPNEMINATAHCGGMSTYRANCKRIMINLISYNIQTGRPSKCHPLTKYLRQ